MGVVNLAVFVGGSIAVIICAVEVVRKYLHRKRLNEFIKDLDQLNVIIGAK